MCRSSIRKRVLKENLIEYKCLHCGLTDTWQGKSITLQLDHIDGNSSNNELSNLRFLCPNCHSQTHTFCKAKNKVSLGQQELERRILAIIHQFDSMRKLIISVGLDDHGSNYHRVSRALNRNLDKIEVKDFYRRVQTLRTAPKPLQRKVERPSKEEMEKLNEKSQD